MRAFAITPTFLSALLLGLGVHAQAPPSVSPTPCTQAYVCASTPYPNTPDTGATPPADQFKCRIGSSSSDGDFAFCYYNKDTGALVRSTPPGVQSLCWESGRPNPACEQAGRRRRRLGRAGVQDVMPRRPSPTSPVALARGVEIARFGKKRSDELEESA